MLRNGILRRRADALLAALPSLRPALVSRYLVDAMWDNPNYWLRFAVVRAALGR